MCGLLSNKLVIYGQYGAYGVCWTSLDPVEQQQIAHQSSSCSSFIPPQGRSCSQSGQDRGQSIFQNLHSVHQQCCSMISKKVVLAGGCRSPSSSLSTSLPPSPSSWQKEDWEPDFLEAALISLEVKVGVVHNCTIFLWSLDVRNIVHRPPMCVFFFLHRALGAILDQNECVFFAKNNCLGSAPEEKNKFWWKKSFLWPREAVFCDLRSFPKNKDHSPKIRIICIQSLFLFQSCDQDIERVLPKIRIDH